MRPFIGTLSALVLSACVGEDPGPASPPPGTIDGGGTPDAPSGTIDGGSDASSTCEPTCSGRCFEGVCGGDAVKSIASGSGLTCAVRTSGSVWCWGRGDAASLGQRLETGGVSCATSALCQAVPTRVPNLESVESVSVGLLAACALTKAGDVYCWGRNIAGEVGVPVSQSSNCAGTNCVDKPTKVALPGRASSVSLGTGTACARLVSGEIWCWGNNTRGELGNGNRNPSNVPVKALVPAAQSVSVSLNNVYHVCAISGRDIWCWGPNTHGQLGHPNTSDQDCTESKCNPTPAKVTGLSTTGPFLEVTAAGGFTCARDQNGRVQCWGYHGYGVVEGAFPSVRVLDLGATAIAGRFHVLCALRAGGGVSCLGESGGAKTGKIESPSAPECIPSTPWSCQHEPQVIGISGARALDVNVTGVALTASGSILSWGDNTNAQLGRDPAGGPKTCPGRADRPAVPCSDTPIEIKLP